MVFMPIDKRNRIFSRRTDSNPRLPLMIDGNKSPGQVNELAPRQLTASGAALQQIVDAQVIERFSPPHAVVNRAGDVMYCSTRTGRFLEPASGIAPRQILLMARRSLRLDLRNVFRECIETGRSARKESVCVEEDDGPVQMISLTVEPLTCVTSREPLFLILFVTQGPAISREETIDRAYPLENETIFQMARDLRETRDRLLSIIEEYETALEAFKSSNEELVSLSDQVQSTNEELVSLNEELHTVNMELNGKLDALDRANSDLHHLLDSTAIATVLLDRNLLIRRFTPAMADIFNILPGDVGRPITDLSSRLQLETLGEDVSAVFANNSVIERKIGQYDGTAHYLLRLSSYKNSDRRIGGVAVTFINVTDMH